MDGVSSVLAAFGLSASAGLNAYIPLLVVSLVARFTDWLPLSEQWQPLTSWWVIGALVILTAIEFFADKFPAVNHVNDAIQTFVRPTAGAVLFAASTGAAKEINPIVAIIAGLVIAGSVHATKTLAVRPAVTATTGGAGNVPVSLLEDVVATGLSILAVIVPVLMAALIIVLTAYIVWRLWRRANSVQAA
jgi:Domain of unknown function (DUF4126)